MGSSVSSVDPPFSKEESDDTSISSSLQGNGMVRFCFSQAEHERQLDRQRDGGAGGSFEQINIPSLCFYSPNPLRSDFQSLSDTRRR